MDFEVKYNERTNTYYLSSPSLVERTIAKTQRMDERRQYRLEVRKEWEAMDPRDKKLYNFNWLKYLNEKMPLYQDQKSKLTQKVVRFGPNDTDILRHLEQQENMSGYIKKLIREDMERGSKQG